MIAPIETMWKGYRFRSRTEARWAVLLDAAGVPFEYEREGYALPAGWYLPDFWLSSISTWLEIKGQAPTYREETLALQLSKATGNPVWIAVGAPDEDDSEARLYEVGEALGVVRVDLTLNIGPGAYAKAKAERFDGKPQLRAVRPIAKVERLRWW